MPTNNIHAMKWGKVYPLLVNKAVRKGRTQAEVDTIITWLTGYTQDTIHHLASSEMNYEQFFQQANLNPDRHLITGSVCGVKLESITDPLMKEIRYLDKLIDELAKGKAMENILRK